MKIAVSLLTLMGTLIFFSSVFYLKPDVPIASLNPKDYMTRRRRRDIFVGPGYKLNTIGLIGMTFGAIGWVTYAFIL